MDSSKLDDLPSLVLHLICDFVWETSPKSLYLLSTVNTNCYRAAQPFIYRNLTLKISRHAKLRRDIEDLMESRLSQQRLEYLRHLKLKGEMPLWERELALQSSETQYIVEGLVWPDYVVPEETVHGDDEFEPRYTRCLVPDVQEDEPNISAHLWSPLVSLLSSLRCLTNLTYACANQFHPSLLDALHRHHPACRLDIRTFRFRSLTDPTTVQNELALVTSPCLHSLTVRYRSRDLVWHDYNEQVAMCAVSLAPNLKHLNILHCTPGDGPLIRGFSRPLASTGTFVMPPKPWMGSIPPAATFKIGSLRSLSLCGDGSLTKLQKWNQHTDLSKLQSLVLVNVSDALILTDVAVNAPLKSLQRLAIDLRPKDPDFNFWSAVEMFFNCLNPLTTLRLYGSSHESLLAKILERHGGTLRELVVFTPGTGLTPPMALTPADILNVRNVCPLLEHLGLGIIRSKSDRCETQIYESLGTFPSLVKLDLYLDCFSGHPDLPNTSELDFSAWLRRWKTALIRDTLINVAIDEALARSIWDVVSTNEPGRPLTRLKIIGSYNNVIGAEPTAELRALVDNMLRSFLFTRSERDDSDDVGVVELGKRAREQREMTYGNDESLATLIFKELWPRKPGSLGWRDDWSSWPLQKTATSS